MTGILLGPRYVPGVAGVVALADDLVSGLNNANWKLGADGFTYHNFNISGSPGPAWINPQSGMDQFEIRVVPVFDPTGASLDVNAGVNVWLNCATGPRWGFVGTSAGGTPGPADEELTVEIRLASTGVVQDTATITLEKTGSLGGGGGGVEP